MKKIIFLVAAAFLSMFATNAQGFDIKGNNIELSSMITAEGIRLPELSFESSLMINRKIGFWWQVDIRRPIIKKQWVDKGYSLKESYGGNGYCGFFYTTRKNLQIMTGVGLEQSKSFFGPTCGLYYEYENIVFSGKGIYSVFCTFKEDYSEKEEIAAGLNNSKLIYIKSYDPNSWYSATILFKNLGNFNLGLTSQRFYSTGILMEYDPYVGLRRGQKLFDQLKFWGIVGRDLEFEKTYSARLGVMISVK